MGTDNNNILDDISALQRLANINALFQQAVAHFQQGRLDDAKVLARNILTEDPAHAEANHLLGLIAIQHEQYDLADKLFLLALDKDPHEARYLYNHGLVLQKTGQQEEALVAYERVIQLDPNFSEAHQNLGNLYREQGRHGQAIASFRKALSLKPDYTEAHYNLGLAYFDQGTVDLACACFKKTVLLRPDSSAAHNSLGRAFMAQGKEENASSSFRKALSLKPDYAEAHYNLGSLLKGQGKIDEAMACFQQAVSVKPDYAEAHCSIGNIFREQGHDEQALACYREAVTRKPGYALAHWAIAMTQIPSFYRDGDDPAFHRAAFSRALVELESWFNANGLEQGYTSVGSQQPFHLAYQEENNRDLLARYGRICTRLMQHWMERQSFPANGDTAGEKIRVGIVSAYIRDHSVWHAIVKGWFTHLDRRRFELHVFHLNTRQDRETEWARKHASSFVQGNRSLHQWVEIILDTRPGVLIYPDIGMDPMTVRLASLRLADVQVAAWGHPETTGLPTMDYYLSAADFEPPGAQKHYTETLVPLPHLGCCYQPLPVTASQPDFARLGIDPEIPILLCAGAPFKYAPRDDRVFTEIARRLGRCQFIFFTHLLQELSRKFRQRLELAFERAGLDFNRHAVFVPWQSRAAFHGLLQQADVFLDTIGFSGFNTAMQAVECGLPVVTREGRFMRGRLASGILRRMGLPELIASNEEDYIALVVRLAQEAEYRRFVRQRIETARHALYEDLAAIRALEDFLIKVV